MNIQIKTGFIIFCFLLLSEISLSKETKMLYGKVIDNTTKEVIPGATIRITGTNSGSYSSSRGTFRLQLPGSGNLKVSSLGYDSKIMTIPENSDSILVSLEPSSVKKGSITVVGNIEPNEVIRRAIDRKNDNVQMLETFKGRLYSKLVLELNGNIFATGSSKNSSVNVATTFGGKIPEGYNMFIMETFSDVMQDYKKKVRHTEIIQRRQTANITPDNNILAISNFMSFYDDEIKLIKTKIVTPLSKDALSYYNFKILSKEILDERYVYVIQVIPSTRLFPTFEGTMKIVEGTYNLVEVDLRPSENTAIPFIDSLNIKQKYVESTEKIWFPAYLDVTGKAKIDVVKGLISFRTDVTATSIYSDVEINHPLPDSIYKQLHDTPEISRSIIVKADADSSKPEFWEKNSLREITDREKDIYKKVDSLIVKDTSKNVASSTPIGFNYSPYFDFNRVNSVSLGLNLSFNIFGFKLSNTGYFSFGLQKMLGSSEISYPLLNSMTNNIELKGSVFSAVSTVSQDKSYPRIVNTIFSALFHFDYFDYFKTDGWNAGLKGNFSSLEYNADMNFYRNFSLINTTNKSIFSKSGWRPNPQILDGDYKVANINLKYGNVNFILPSERFEYEIFAETYLGQKTTNNSFFNLNGTMKLSIPTFETGYGKMLLSIITSGGKGSSYMPAQFLFRMPVEMLFINKYGNFFSAKPGEFGGREFYNVHGMFNLTDIWWRFFGLPTYEGRGLNLILAGSYGRYFSKGESIYKETGNYQYSEIGFGLTRIPAFISNVVYLSLDARWGVGPIASGNFGWALSVSLPF